MFIKTITHSFALIILALFSNNIHAEFPINDFTNLDADSVKMLAPGKIRHCVRANGRTWTIKFHADGKLNGESSRMDYDEGKWKINANGQSCEDWSDV